MPSQGSNAVLIACTSLPALDLSLLHVAGTSLSSCYNAGWGSAHAALSWYGLTGRCLGLHKCCAQLAHGFAHSWHGCTHSWHMVVLTAGMVVLMAGTWSYSLLAWLYSWLAHGCTHCWYGCAHGWHVVLLTAGKCFCSRLRSAPGVLRYACQRRRWCTHCDTKGAVLPTTAWAQGRVFCTMAYSGQLVLASNWRVLVAGCAKNCTCLHDKTCRCWPEMGAAHSGGARSWAATTTQ